MKKIRVLFDSYDKVMQNPAGGVQSRIRHLSQALKPYCDVKMFDKWNDRFQDFDVLHVFKIGTDRYEMIKAAKKAGMKIAISTVIPVEDISVHLRISRLLGKLPLMTGFKYIKLALEFGDVLLPQSTIEKDYIHELYSTDINKMIVMPNGCNYDYKEKNDCFIKKYGITQPYAICVGRIDDNKNQLALINAVKNTDIELFIIGGPDAESGEYYKKCIKAATDNIHFTGWLNQDDPLLFSAYQNAQLSILPSKKEIFGNSLIEGACAGNNLSCTKNLTTLGDYNLARYVEVFDPNKVEQIRNVVLKQYYKEKDPGQGEYFQNIFSWDEIAKKHYQIYREILNA